jgi:hypothetical protein
MRLIHGASREQKLTRLTNLPITHCIAINGWHKIPQIDAKSFVVAHISSEQVLGVAVAIHSSATEPVSGHIGEPVEYGEQLDSAST